MEHAHFLLQVSTNTSKVRGTKSAMQHTRSEEGSAHDSNRNMLNHDRSSLDQKTLCRHETGAVSLVEKKRRGEQLSQRSAFYAIILKGREWTGEAKMQTRRQVHGHCRWKMETRTGVQQWRSRGVVRPKMYLESNTREDSTHGHHQMVNTKIRLIAFFAAKDGEALSTVSKNKTGS
ncbi:uncharacterized protein ACBT57_023253 isoform 2-T2 [Dama dama]